MPHFSLPLCYFPTTALFVDNSHDFLLNFVLQLNGDLAYRIFDEPSDALDYVHKKHSELDIPDSRCLKEYIDANNYPMANHRINLDFAAIHAEVYNPRRFSEISVIVVNCTLPEMSGVEFCKRIKNPNLKTILLTEPGEEKMAVLAVNEGVIDRFLQKNDPNVAELIIKSIKDLQFDYFQTLSNRILPKLSITSPPCLYDKKFAEFFFQVCAEKKISEYYLADKSGSFLLLDEDANVSFLIVKNEEDMQLHYNLALDNKASNEILAQLSNGEKIPCFWQATTLPVEWNTWASCLVPARRLTSEQTYFHAYVQGSVLFDVGQEKILSFHRHLEALDTEELFLV